MCGVPESSKKKYFPKAFLNVLRKDADSKTPHTTEIVSSTTKSLNCRHMLVEEYGELGTDLETRQVVQIQVDL